MVLIREENKLLATQTYSGSSKYLYLSARILSEPFCDYMKGVFKLSDQNFHQA